MLMISIAKILGSDWSELVLNLLTLEAGRKELPRPVFD